MKKMILTLLVFALASNVFASSVYHQLVITDTVVKFGYKSRHAIAINGQIPGPTLEFNLGDSVTIDVVNYLHHETSIHWHGLLLPNEQDGVPYLTTSTIYSHKSHRYTFVIRQTGTYWYHSHSMLQEQIGMYGAIVIHDTLYANVPDEVLLLSDWSDEKPEQIERSLHFATDWYMIKKQAVQSYSEAVKERQLGVKLVNEFKRMHAMDVSDVYYESFLINGKPRLDKKNYNPGDTIRLRVINGSASTYFWLNYAGGKIIVIGTDGMPVVPVEVDRLIVGVSETYDLLVILPQKNHSYQFKATSEDRIGYADVWLGKGTPQFAPNLDRLDYFAGMKMMNDMMNLDGSMDDMGMQMSLQQMDMNIVMYPEIINKSVTDTSILTTLNYSMLKSPFITTLPHAADTTYHFELTGNMNRYVWTINNKTISESDNILIKPGSTVRMIITNNSMMRHPMHLHGHFFRVVNGQGEYSPLKTVLDIMPMEVDTIEFYASEEYGDWYFHCHILYHMMAGMGRIFTYENSPPNPQLPDKQKAMRKVYHDDKRYYLGAEISAESNSFDGEIGYMNTRWKLDLEWRMGYNKATGYETESHWGRIWGKNQFLYTYVGWDSRSRTTPHSETNWLGTQNTKNNRDVLCFGIQYTLPLFFILDLRIDHTGYPRLQIKREDFALTERVRLWGMYNSDNEYAFGAKYIVTKYFATSTHYDSDMGFGAGFTFTY